MRTGGRPILGHHHMLGLWESSPSGYQWPKPTNLTCFFRKTGDFPTFMWVFWREEEAFQDFIVNWSFVRHFLAPFSGSKKYHFLMVWCRMIIRRWLQVLWGSAVLHLSTTRISIPGDEDEDWAKSGSRALSEKKRQAPWKGPWWNGWNDGKMRFETMEIWGLFSDKAPSWFLRITSQRRKRSERPTWWFFEKQERWDGRTKHRF